MKIKYFIFILLLVAVSISVVQAGEFENAQNTALRICGNFNEKLPYTVTYTDAQIRSFGYIPQSKYGYQITIKDLYCDVGNGTLVTYINSQRGYGTNVPIRINNPVRWYMPFDQKITGAQAMQEFVVRAITYLDSLPDGQPINDDTLIVYPAIDGYADDTTATTYASLRADTGAAAASGSTTIVNAPLIDSAATDPNFHIFRRGILSFNTSGIPDDATITSANLSVKILAKENALGEPAYGITGGTLASNTSIAAGDFDGWSAVRYSSDVAYTSLTANQRTNWSINAAGLANISKTQFFVVYMRDSWDIDNSAPAYTKNKATSITWQPVGNTTSSAQPYIQIIYTPAAPLASFSKDKTGGDAPLTVTFTDTSSAGLPISAWFWVFGDGSTTNNTQQNPIHTFSSAGTYNVNLTITNSVGSNTTATQAITVTTAAPPPITFDPTYYGNWTEFYVNSTATLTDFQVKMDLTNATGSTNLPGVFYTNGTTQPDWEDIVWTSTTNSTLGYWKENNTETSTNSTWWIKVPSIANDNTTKIRLFYGNTSVVSYANITNMSALGIGDDFLGVALDTSKWTTSTGTVSLVNYTAILHNDAALSDLKSTTNFSVNYTLRGRMDFEDHVASNNVFGFFQLTDNNARFTNYDWDKTVAQYSSHTFKDTLGSEWTNLGTGYHGYHVWEVQRNSTTNVKFLIDNVLVSTHADTVHIYTGDMYFRAYANTALTETIDWLFIRKFAPAEPFLTLSAAGPVVSPPVASFTVNRNPARIPQSITVTDTSTNTPTSWAWSWGDGTANSTTQNPTHEYTKRGRWNIILTATNAGGSGTNSANYVRVVGYENYY